MITASEASQFRQRKVLAVPSKHTESCKSSWRPPLWRVTNQPTSEDVHFAHVLRSSRHVLRPLSHWKPHGRKQIWKKVPKRADDSLVGKKTWGEHHAAPFGCSGRVAIFYQWEPLPGGNASHCRWMGHLRFCTSELRSKTELSWHRERTLALLVTVSAVVGKRKAIKLNALIFQCKTKEVQGAEHVALDFVVFLWFKPLRSCIAPTTKVLPFAGKCCVKEQLSKHWKGTLGQCRLVLAFFSFF